jgi:hypothetical protein
MARLIIGDYQKWGEKLRQIVGDDTEKANFLKDPKAVLMNFMTPPTGTSWNDLKIHIHEDTATDINIALPHRGDVEASEKQIDPATTGSVAYTYPDYCTPGKPAFLPPDGGTTADETRAIRLKAYRTRLGDYIMTRCK